MTPCVPRKRCPGCKSCARYSRTVPVKEWRNGGFALLPVIDASALHRKPCPMRVVQGASA